MKKIVLCLVLFLCISFVSSINVLTEEIVLNAEDDFDDDVEINNLAVSIFGGFVFFIGMVTLGSLIRVYYKIDFNQSMSQMVMSTIENAPKQNVLRTQSPATTTYSTPIQTQLTNYGNNPRQNIDHQQFLHPSKKPKLKFESR